MTAALEAATAAGPPRERLHALALGLFDAIDDHSWVAAQLSSGRYLSGYPTIFDRFGQQVDGLGVPRARQFRATSVSVAYVVGAAGQNAANATAARAQPSGDRAGYLAEAARAWADLDPQRYPFASAVADQFREHDDRADFLAGVEVIVAGFSSLGQV